MGLNHEFRMKLTATNNPMTGRILLGIQTVAIEISKHSPVIVELLCESFITTSVTVSLFYDRLYVSDKI